MGNNNPNTCNNCGLSTAGNFCHHCGERLEIQARIDFGSLYATVSSQLFSLQSTFLRTLLELTTRPGTMVRHYIKGQRKPYYEPVKYYLLLLTGYFLLFELSGFTDYLIEIAEQTVSLVGGEDEELMLAQINNVGEEINLVLSELFKAFDVLLTLILAIVAHTLIRGKGYNFVEILVLFIFLSAQVYIIKAILLILMMSLPLVGVIIVSAVDDFIVGAYYCWGVCQFYRFNKLRHILLSAAIYILAFVVFAAIMSGLYGIYQAFS
jgi:hypothetical protein